MLSCIAERGLLAGDADDNDNNDDCSNVRCVGACVTALVIYLQTSHICIVFTLCECVYVVGGDCELRKIYICICNTIHTYFSRNRILNSMDIFARECSCRGVE